MIKIKIIAFGKIKDASLNEIIKNYSSRINHFCNLQIIELNESKIKDESKNSEILIALKEEAKQIEKHLKDSFNILLDVKSKKIDSIQFSNIIKNNLDKWIIINFFIGSSYGFDEQIKDKFNLKISFSDLTFNHQIFRLLLLEQIYRSFTIIKNIKYHK